ncbi:D-alanine--poly(phosphoribitol) ligase subunit 1 [bioreactor metagenome]|uniref:D-alanine--poly(Phosphoribitol) ligase subunit 1 n=2 Tax=root TaxID=1 RepID=A0A644UQQ3_9ZZZZ
MLMQGKSTTDEDLKPSSVRRMLRLLATEYIKGIKFLRPDGTMGATSYAALWRQGNAVAAGLDQQNIPLSMPLIITTESREDFLMALWGGIIRGNPVAPLPHAGTGSSFQYANARLRGVLSCMDAVVICHTEDQATLLHRDFGLSRRPLVTASLKESGYGQFYENPSPLSPNDCAVIQFSSGSTGTPKGIALSNKGILHNLAALREAENLTEDMRFASWLPYHHDFGLFASHLLAAYSRVDEIRMDTEEFLRRPHRFLRLIHDTRATHIPLTPTSARLLLKSVDRAEKDGPLDFSCIKMLILGAEMIAPDLCRSLHEKLGPLGMPPEAVCPGYGLGENVVMASLKPHTRREKLWSLSRQAWHAEKRAVVAEDGEPSFTVTEAGLPARLTTLRIVDENGNVLPAMHMGKLQIQGPSTFLGYYTADSLVQAQGEDWLDTGDVGFLSEDGEFFPTGRVKELIIHNGKNIAPSEVEAVAAKAAGTAWKQCIAVGVLDHNSMEERLRLFVVPASRHAHDLAAETRTKATIAAIFGMPVTVVHYIAAADIPRTTSGKIMRHELAARFASAPDNAASPQAPQVEDTPAVLASAWANALERPGFAPENSDSFFACGGDSFRASCLAASLERKLNKKLPLDFAYRHTTFLEQLHALNEQTNKGPVSELEVLLRDIAADAFQQDRESISCNAPLLSYAPNPAALSLFASELRSVFGNKPKVNEALACTSLTEMATIIETLAPNQGDPVSLMPFQQTLYFHTRSIMRNEPTGISCYIVHRLEIMGAIDVPVMEKSFETIVARHAMLRAYIDDSAERPMLRIQDSVDLPAIQVEDLSNLSEAQQQARIETIDRESHDIRCDLRTPPLFRVRLCRMGHDQWLLIMHIDHMVVDGYSSLTFVRGLLDIYEDLKDGKTLPPSEASRSFSYYSWLAACREKTAGYQSDMDWLLNEFTDLPPRITLPMKRNPAMLESVRFSTLYTRARPGLFDHLRQWAAQDDTLSLNSILFAALFKLANIWSNQNDLIINMPVFNREQFRETSRNVFGSFIDIVPVRLRTSFAEPIADMARRLERHIRRVLARSVSSIDLSRQISSRTGRQGAMSSLIFSNSVNLVRNSDLAGRSLQLTENLHTQTGAPGTWIDVILYTVGDTWHINWNYVRELFDEGFVSTLAEQYEAVLADAVNTWAAGNEGQPFSSYAAMPPRQKACLNAVNATQTPASSLPLYDAVAHWAQNTPDAPALTFNGQCVCYAELHHACCRMATLMARHGIGRGDFVAVSLPRGTDLLVSQFGALLAGAAYIPVDPAYPCERIAYMIADSQASALITTPDVAARLNHDDLKNVRLLFFPDETELPAADIPKTTTVLCKQDMERIPEQANFPKPEPQDLAYMIYTSGSTGNPKGVMVSHANFRNFIGYVLRELARGCTEQFALVTSPSFDMTLTSNLGACMSGATLHILSEEDTRDVEKLFAFLEGKQITLLNVTPSHFGMLAAMLDSMASQPALHPEMRILLGGEVINTDDITTWVRHYPSHRIFNEYGPTEATVASSFFEIPLHEGQCSLDVVPIGKPLDNTQYHILNDELQTCMIGVPGRLFIGGYGVAKGYWHRAEQTAKAFVPDPFSGGIMYDTGDMARWLETGDVQFLGRNDRQVNLRGYRIELGEIEGAMLACACVSSASAVLQTAADGSSALAAFYTVTAPLEESALKTHLKKHLPEYMVPRFFCQLQTMPQTPSGKLDVKKLPHIVTAARPQTEREYIAPRTPMEEGIARCWQSIFHLERIGIHDDFWLMGGDSIRATRLLAALRARGFNYGLQDLFEKPTIARLAEKSQAQPTAKTWVRLAGSTNQPSITGTTLLCLPYAGGSPAMFHSLAAALGDTADVYSAVYKEAGAHQAHTIDSVAESLLQYLPPAKKLIILGYCYGAYVAHALIKLLNESGRAPNAVILTGATPPGAQQTAYAEASLYSRLDDPETEQRLERIYQSMLVEMPSEERKQYWQAYRHAVCGMKDYRFGSTAFACPCKVLTGEQEEYPFVREYAATWADCFPACTHQMLPGGHMLVQTHPETFCNSVKAFIDDTLSKGGEA